MGGRDGDGDWGGGDVMWVEGWMGWMDATSPDGWDAQMHFEGVPRHT